MLELHGKALRTMLQGPRPIALKGHQNLQDFPMEVILDWGQYSHSIANNKGIADKSLFVYLYLFFNFNSKSHCLHLSQLTSRVHLRVDPNTKEDLKKKKKLNVYVYLLKKERN